MSREDVTRILGFSNWKSEKEIHFQLSLRGYPFSLKSIQTSLRWMYAGGMVERRYRNVRRVRPEQSVYEYRRLI